MDILDTFGANMANSHDWWIFLNKSGVKRLNTLGYLDQYMAQHGHIVKQSYCKNSLGDDFV